MCYCRFLCLYFPDLHWSKPCQIIQSKLARRVESSPLLLCNRCPQVSCLGNYILSCCWWQDVALMNNNKWVILELSELTGTFTVVRLCGYNLTIIPLIVVRLHWLEMVVMCMHVFVFQPRQVAPEPQVPRSPLAGCRPHRPHPTVPRGWSTSPQ